MRSVRLVSIERESISLFKIIRLNFFGSSEILNH